MFHLERLFWVASTVEVILACIPTQNVDVTTTTTTEDPFPCSVCSKIYNTVCQGYGIPSASNWCAKEADVPVSYSLEDAGYTYQYNVMNEYTIDEQSCVSILSCPSGTTSRYIIIEAGNQEGEGNNLGVEPTLAFCAETGSEAGIWKVDIDGHVWQTSQMACRNT